MTDQKILHDLLDSLTQEAPSRRLRDVYEHLSTALDRQDSTCLDGRPITFLQLMNSSSLASSRLSILLESISWTIDDEHQRWRSYKAIVYPVILAVASCLVFLCIALFIVPQFMVLFDDFGMQTSGLTGLLLASSSLIRQYPLATAGLILLAGAGLAVAVVFGGHFAGLTRYFGFLSAGGTANLIAMARFTRHLADLLSVQVPVPEAIELAGRSCGNAYYKSAAARLASAARGGSEKTKDSSVAHSFPANLMIALEGDGTGQPNLTLLYGCANAYRDLVRQRWEGPGEIIQYLAVIAMGLVVVLVAFSLFLPLIQLVHALA